MTAPVVRLDDRGGRSPLVSIEAEQALLGCLLYDAEALEAVGELRPADFAEEAHGRLFAAISDASAKGRTATPELIFSRFRQDQALTDLGGLQYLGDLLDRAPPISAAGSYAHAVRDLALRRKLVRFTSDFSRLLTGDMAADAVEIVAEAERELTDIASAGPARTAWQGSGDVVRFALDYAQSRGEQVDFPFGLTDLDALAGGMTAGEMTVIAGRPGMAKSTAAIQVAKASASRGLGTCFFSLEMGAAPLGLRMAADVAFDRSAPIYSGETSNPTYDRARKGRLTREQWQRMEAAGQVIAEWPLLFDTRPGLTVSQIEACARRAYRNWERQGVARGPLIVDHIGIVRPEKDRSGNKVVETGDVSRGLAELAKRLEVPVLALCQVNRSNEKLEDKRPSLADLRWSGQIEEDARQVIFLYRPEYYYRPPEDPDAEDLNARIERETKLDRVRRKLFWIVAKNNNGELGQVETFCDVACSAIRDRRGVR